MIKMKLTALLLVVALTGCVTGTRSLQNLNVPDYENDKTASGTVYIKAITDNRTFEQKPKSPSTPSVRGVLSETPKEKLSTLIGRQRNGYGAAMGDVALPEGVTVQDKMRELLTEGLESRGYTVVDDQNANHQVSVDIEKFWAWFTPGFASVGFESNVQCTIDFESASGEKTVNVEGKGNNRGQVASNANWELSFKRAYLDFLKDLDKTLDSNGL